MQITVQRHDSVVAVIRNEKHWAVCHRAREVQALRILEDALAIPTGAICVAEACDHLAIAEAQLYDPVIASVTDEEEFRLCVDCEALGIIEPRTRSPPKFANGSHDQAGVHRNKHDPM